MVTDGRGKADAVFVGVIETVLQRAKKTFTAGDGEHHAAEFAEKTLPTFDRDATQICIGRFLQAKETKLVLATRISQRR